MTEFLPEAEEPILPNQNKIVLPVKSKSKMTSKRKKKVRNFIIKWAVITLIIIAATTYGVYKVNEWFNYHTIKWQSPIQVPLWIEPRNNNQSENGHDVIPEAQAQEIDFTGATFIQKTSESKLESPQPNISSIVKAVYQLESSGGKNDSCRAKGLYNGYGYGQSTFTWNCFESHDEVTAKVTAWFEKRIPTMGLSTALCYYNTGHKVADCDYYQKYLRIK